MARAAAFVAPQSTIEAVARCEVCEAIMRKCPWFLETMAGRKVFAVQRSPRLLTPKVLWMIRIFPQSLVIFKIKEFLGGLYNSISRFVASRMFLPRQVPAFATTHVGSPISLQACKILCTICSKHIRLLSPSNICCNSLHSFVICNVTLVVI
jgi:hypothetical protein